MNPDAKGFPVKKHVHDLGLLLDSKVKLCRDRVLGKRRRVPRDHGGLAVSGTDLV